MRTFLEKKLIDDFDSVIQEKENIPFFVHVIANFLCLAFIFVFAVFAIIPFIMAHYIIKITQLFILFIHIKKSKEKKKSLKKIFQ